MSSSQDILQAKQALSARLLRAGLRGNAFNRRPALNVRTAIGFAGQNVHAVGIGSKVVSGEATTQECIRIYVVQKVAPSILPPRDRLPEMIDGIPTDVIESPPAVISARGRARRGVRAAAAASCSSNRRSRQRPIVGGISAAHFEVTAGTLAYFCRSTLSGDDPSKIYILSNNHVFANVNRADEGDDLDQPGPEDGGTAGDHFASFFRAINLRLGGIFPNKIDAAIGELLPGIDFRLEICNIGRITGVATAEQNMQVRKHGRTTGYTEGRISETSYDSIVRVERGTSTVPALFQNQIRVERDTSSPAFALRGDSGSLVVDQSTAEAVGLYFAGPDSGEYGVANHIGDVLEELQIELL